MSKILVTGGAGFIGSHIVDRLLLDGHSVVVVDNLSTGNLDNLNEKSLFYKEDIRDINKLTEIFEKERPEYVYHLAAQISVSYSVNNPFHDAEINIMGSLNILELCSKYSVKKLIFSSTGGAIYGDADCLPTSEDEIPKPISPYAITKYSIEKYIIFYSNKVDLKYSILRYSNVYGLRQNPFGEAGVVAIFHKNMKEGKNPIIFGDGNQTRDYIEVSDVANINIECINKANNLILNVGTGFETKTIEVFDKLNRYFDNKYKPFFEKERLGDLKRSCLNNSLLKDNIKVDKFISFEEGIKRLMSHKI